MQASLPPHAAVLSSANRSATVRALVFGLLASSALNAVLLCFVLSPPKPLFAVEPPLRVNGPSSRNDGQVAGGPNPGVQHLVGLCKTESPEAQCQRRTIERAEAAFKRNLQRQKETLDQYSLQVDSTLFPVYPCPEAERVGSWDQGGKFVCSTPLYRCDNIKVLYSIQSRGDVSFELGMSQLFNVESHVFDASPTEEVEALARNSSRLRLHRFAAALTGATQNDPKKEKNLFDVMEVLGHTYVDVLRVDWGEAPEALAHAIAERESRDMPVFGQLLLGFDSQLPSSVSVSLNILSLIGYRLFHVERLPSQSIALQLSLIHGHAIHLCHR